LNTPNAPYAWQTKENPILLPAAKGKYLIVVGLITRKSKLYFEILETNFNSVETKRCFELLFASVSPE